LNRYSFRAFNRSLQQMVPMASNILGKRIMNQVGTSIPNYSANKEFIETLGGNYLIWDNLNNTVQGGLPNTYGYKGDSAIYYNPVPLEEPTDNGKSWSVESWFRHPTADLYGILFSKFRGFLELLEKAGLYDAKRYEFPFLIDGKSYTIFIPSDEALADFQADTLSSEDLASLLRYHFVRGEKIFTDNKKSWNDYETLRKDEFSTQVTTYYSTLNIRPGPDVIEILDSNNNLYVSVAEAEGTTNVMIAYDTDELSTDDTDFIITTIVHGINKVLDPAILR